MEPKKENSLKEIFKFALIALLVVVPFRLLIAQPYFVSGPSMDPTFHSGDYLIVDQISYRFEDIQRGDVIVFRYPKDPSKHYIKRVIGLPGETVEIRGTTVMLKKDDVIEWQEILTEPYVAEDNQKPEFLTVELGDNEYFVMGDNRRLSSDSRIWGPVPRENIVGRAFARLLPVTQIGVFPGSHHFETPTSTNTEANE